MTPLTLIDAYNDLEEDVDFDTYRKIVYGFMKYMVKRILGGEHIEIPKVGKFGIIGKKVNLNPKGTHRGGVDWPLTMDLWERKPETRNKKFIRYMNDHTDNYYFRFAWSKKNVKNRFKDLFNFKPTFTNKKLLAAAIENGQDYIRK